MSIDIMVTRHGKKEKKEVVTGGEEDRNLVDLSVDGKVDAYKVGNENIKQHPHYSNIGVTTSDFLRTRRTAEMMLQGANYRIDDSGLVAVVQRADIGLSGINWKATELPPYTDDGERGKTFRKVLFTDFYLPHDGRADLPVMAKFAYALFDAAINGINNRMKETGESKNGLVLVATHAPIIDALGNSLYGSLVVEPDGKTHVENYPGVFMMGEFISGSIPKPGQDPEVVFNVKGKEVVYRLSTLAGMRDTHKKFAGHSPL